MHLHKIPHQQTHMKTMHTYKWNLVSEGKDDERDCNKESKETQMQTTKYTSIHK